MPQVFLSIGSNINRDENICLALDALSDKFSFMRVSSVYETQAVGFVGDAFYNLVAAVNTDLSPADINALLKKIETDLGRDQAQKGFSSRTIDIDLLTYGDFVGSLDGIDFPRAEIFKFGFVLYPLVEVAGEQLCPGDKRTYSQCLNGLTDSGGLQRILFEWAPHGVLPAFYRRV